jgi:hypothetical protein
MNGNINEEFWREKAVTCYCFASIYDLSDEALRAKVIEVLRFYGVVGGRLIFTGLAGIRLVTFGIGVLIFTF